MAIGPGGKPGAIKKLWESQPVDGPDGFAIARSGRFYIALAGSNQIVVVGPDGKEVERFPGEPQIGSNGSPVAFDTPSSAMFLGTRLIVANQAYFDGSPASQAVLDVETREQGVPPYIPRRAGRKPARRR